jgi:hypothetical protein
MKSMIIVTILCATLFATGAVKGGRRLLTLNTARSLSVNAFTVSSGLNFFSETPTFGSGPAKFNAWQVDGDVAMSYGAVENVEVYIASRLYQDTHSAVNNFPSYVIVGAKYGNIEIDRKSIIMGANIEFEFGIGGQQNIPFEDYASKGFSISPQVSLSYFTDQFLPDRSFSLHLNLGLTQHFDNGKEIYLIDSKKDGKDTITDNKNNFFFEGAKRKYVNSQVNEGNSNSFHYGVGLNLPTELIDIMVELDGYSFLTAPNEFAYGREGRIVTNIAFRYKMSNFMSFDFGLGFNLSEGANTTNKIINDKVSKNTNYSSWRGFLGMNFSLQPTGTYSNSRNEIERNEYNRKIQTFKSLIEEQENTEVIQKELENLKDEREKAEKELEELKRILEDK